MGAKNMKLLRQRFVVKLLACLSMVLMLLGLCLPLIVAAQPTAVAAAITAPAAQAVAAPTPKPIDVAVEFAVQQSAAGPHRVGVSVHRVDLKDHLGGSLNNLRFTSTTWEGDLFRKSGFYTNRIRYDEMVALFDRVGFDCRLLRVMRWDALPTPRTKIDEAFRYLPDDDLLVSGFDVALRRKR